MKQQHRNTREHFDNQTKPNYCFNQNKPEKSWLIHSGRKNSPELRHYQGQFSPENFQSHLKKIKPESLTGHF